MTNECDFQYHLHAWYTCQDYIRMDLIHIPRAVGKMRETREKISWPKGITSRPFSAVVRKSDDQHLKKWDFLGGLPWFWTSVRRGAMRKIQRGIMPKAATEIRSWWEGGSILLLITSACWLHHVHWALSKATGEIYEGCGHIEVTLSKDDRTNNTDMNTNDSNINSNT